MNNRGQGKFSAWKYIMTWTAMFGDMLNTRPIRDKRSPHCGAKQRKKHLTVGRYNFMPCTFKNSAK